MDECLISFVQIVQYLIRKYLLVTIFTILNVVLLKITIFWMKCFITELLKLKKWKINSSLINWDSYPVFQIQHLKTKVDSCVHMSVMMITIIIMIFFLNFCYFWKRVCISWRWHPVALNQVEGQFSQTTTAWFFESIYSMTYIRWLKIVGRVSR